MNINAAIGVETYCNNYASRTPGRKCGERRERQGELPGDENYSRCVDTHEWWMKNRYALLLDLIDTDVATDETKYYYGEKRKIIFI